MGWASTTDNDLVGRPNLSVAELVLATRWKVADSGLPVPCFRSTDSGEIFHNFLPGEVMTTDRLDDEWNSVFFRELNDFQEDLDNEQGITYRR